MTSSDIEPFVGPERSGPDGLGGMQDPLRAPVPGTCSTESGSTCHGKEHEPVDDPVGPVARVDEVRAELAGQGVVRLRLEVAYDGAGFCGWARQPGLRSVQGELEVALRAALRIPAEIPVRVAVAGRTDAGVHATGQVCHADVPAAAWLAAGDQTHGVGSDGGGSVSGSAAGDPGRPGDAHVYDPGTGGPDAPGAQWLRRRTNGLLGHDVRIRAVGVAPAGFHARWSGAWRRYRYLVADQPAGQDPRTRGHVLWHPRRLDVAAMSAAAAPFAGEHDFAAFCRARPGASSVRTIHELGWARVDPADDTSPARFEIRADAFCHSMVRSLVGAFLAVGDGRWPGDRPAELLAAGQRVPVLTVAPAHPLTLVEVGYPPDAELGAQAERARRWRGR